MLRQLLTLLAVFSGFTLAAEPVSAAETRVVSITAARAADDCTPVVSSPLQLESNSDARRNQRQDPCPKRKVIIWSPSVQLHADRARE